MSAQLAIPAGFQATGKEKIRFSSRNHRKTLRILNSSTSPLSGSASHIRRFGFPGACRVTFGRVEIVSVSAFGRHSGWR
jgi:hypothetical protein